MAVYNLIEYIGSEGKYSAVATFIKNHKNNEISQEVGDIPLNRLDKELEYLKTLPSLELLVSYVSLEKEYKVPKESMINYKGKMYSVPTKYINLVHLTDK